MYLPSSAIIVKVEKNLLDEKKLENYHFTVSNQFDNNKKFYSINFFDENFGEIHWSNSFEHGQMNIISFVKKNNIFFLLTSSVQHHIFLKEILSEYYGKAVDLKIIKLPFPVPSDVELNIKNYKNVDIDANIGIVGKLTNKNKTFLLKIYTNGVMTYSLTDRLDELNFIHNVSLEILENYGVFNNA